VRRSSIASSSPLWLAAVRPDPKDDVQYAAHQQRQAAAVDHAEVAAALCEASSAFRRGWVQEHYDTLREANNLASVLKRLKHYGEAKSLLRKTTRVALRVLGESHETTLKSRWIYAAALDSDPAATLDDLREAVATLEDTARTARRVLSGAHPLTVDIERELRIAQAVLRPRETPLRAQEDK
jgi:hypothetical protein